MSQKQEYKRIIKYLPEGDNWKFLIKITTDVTDLDDWTKKLIIQASINTEPLETITLSGTLNEYVGELTETASSNLGRGEFFMKVMAEKTGQETRTLTDPLSRLHII